MPEKVLRLLGSIHPLQPEVEDYIRKKIYRKSYKRKEQMLRIGQICDTICFIEKGLVRAYFESTGGEEVTSWFMQENDLIMSVESFYDGVPTKEIIECVEDTDVIVLHKRDLDWLYDHYPVFNINGRKLTEQYYKRSVKGGEIPRRNNMQIRYEMFLTLHPNIANRAPAGHVATYLGMTPQSFSRIRSYPIQKK